MSYYVLGKQGRPSDKGCMSIRAQRISFGLAVLPFVVVTALSVIFSAAELFILATSGMAFVFLLVAHLIVAPIASFVGGLEKVGDSAATAAEVLAAMPAEPVAVLALAASDAADALQQAAADAGSALGFTPGEPYATVHELPLPTRSESSTRVAA